MTRTVIIGNKPPPVGAIDAFTRVLRGHIALAAARFPTGTNGMQLESFWQKEKLNFLSQVLQN